MAKQSMAKRSRRFMAYTIDVMLFWVAIGIGLVLFLNNFEEKSPFSILYVVILPLVFTGLQLNLLFNSSQSIGKVHQNIVIVDEVTGQRAGFAKILLRLFVSMVMRIIPPMGLVDAICIFGKGQKCLHDMIAETAVVDELDVKRATPATP